MEVLSTFQHFYQILPGKNVDCREKKLLFSRLFYAERKKTKTGKIRPTLTHHRNDLLFNASNFVTDIEGVDFAFANIHGDICVRLAESHNDRNNFPFSSMDNLKILLCEKGIEVPDM